uniref:Uncharacterized protein n=1 Tax=Cacopsylla melanoneura TaxID=428564 RepID=A0A8D9DU95_9HEMI
MLHKRRLLLTQVQVIPVLVRIVSNAVLMQQVFPEVGPVAQDLVTEITLGFPCMKMAVSSQVTQVFVAGSTDITLEPLLIVQLDADIIVIVIDNGYVGLGGDFC